MKWPANDLFLIVAGIASLVNPASLENSCTIPGWAADLLGQLIVSPSERTCARLGQHVAFPQASRDWKVINILSVTIRTESRIIIAGSVDEVWEYVCDVGRWPEWAPTVLKCWVRGGGPLQPGSWVDQRAKDLGRTHARSQQVTVVEAPRYVAFAGTMGTSASRWGMELESANARQTDAKMWIEVDIAGIMRAVPGLFKGSLQRVSNREMVAIKAAVESATREGAEP